MKTTRLIMASKNLEKVYMKGKKAWDRYYMLREIDRRKYYEGFNVGKEKQMFKEELEDLEDHYRSTLVRLQVKVEDCLPSLLYYMKEFLTIHERNEEVRDKLDALLEKTGEGDCYD